MNEIHSINKGDYMINRFNVESDWMLWTNCNHYGWKLNNDDYIELAPSDEELKILSLKHIGFTGMVSNISISYPYYASDIDFLGYSIEFDIHNNHTSSRITVLGKRAYEISKWLRHGILIHVEADEDGFESRACFKRFIATSITRIEL